MCVSNIGMVYQQQGMFEEALTPLQDALDVQRKISPRANKEIAQTLSRIGSVYYDLRSKFPEALQYHIECLEMSRECSPDALTSIYLPHFLTLAKLCKQARRGARIGYMFNATEMQRTCLPSMHPSVAVTLTSIGSVYARQGKLDDALGLLSTSFGY